LSYFANPRFSRVALAALCGLALLGCGPQFDPPSELKSLRILAVQKDEPYAKAGDTVNLSMLWQDASPKHLDAQGNPRPIQITWDSACVNPPGDLYFGCFPQLAQATLAQLGTGDQFSVTIPTDIIHASGDPKQPPYGTAFVFFAACAGTITPVVPTEDSPLPFACKDPNSGALLGSEDFVAGYSTIYVFNDFTNSNPVLTDASQQGHFTFQAQTFDATCVDASCLTLASPTDPCASPGDARCVPICADDGDVQKCTGYDLKPVIDGTLPANAEADTAAELDYGRAYDEEMWIDYYADHGNFSPPVKLLRDAQTGFSAAYDTKFYAPKDAGPIQVWAVVHDNRGGVSWEGFTLGAK
jgi:hypothetical protein